MVVYENGRSKLARRLTRGGERLTAHRSGLKETNDRVQIQSSDPEAAKAAAAMSRSHHKSSKQPQAYGGHHESESLRTRARSRRHPENHPLPCFSFHPAFIAPVAQPIIQLFFPRPPLRKIIRNPLAAAVSALFPSPSPPPSSYTPTALARRRMCNG